VPTSSQRPVRANGVPIEELASELIYVAWLSKLNYGAAAKASLNRANMSHGLDTKPCELPMARVKPN
jgi:hypothetical protein